MTLQILRFSLNIQLEIIDLYQQKLLDMDYIEKTKYYISPSVSLDKYFFKIALVIFPFTLPKDSSQQDAHTLDLDQQKS